MANFDISLDELDIKARVKLMIWEITKDDGRKFASPQEIAKRLNLKPGYIRSVISQIEDFQVLTSRREDITRQGRNAVGSE